MYARCLRRTATRSLTRQRTGRIVLKTCLSTAESPQTNNDVNPPPASSADSTKRSESWLGVASSSSNNASPIQQTHGTALDEICDRTRECDEKQSSRDVNRENLRKRKEVASDSICVVPDSKALSMPGMLHLIREFEQRFGHMREFRFIRDKDYPSNYMKALFIRFRDEESLQRIRDALRGKHEGTIMVGAPPEWDRLKELDGGVGLEDVQDLLRSASEQTEAMDDNQKDKEIEKVVESVERVLQSAEANVDDVQQSEHKPGPPTPSASMDSCECRIEILKSRYESLPHLHERDSYFSKNSNRRAVHIARSFIQWGGFYPHYRFGSDEQESKQSLGGIVEESVADMSEEEKVQAETIRAATSDMRKAIMHYRRLLRQLGQRDHGLEIRDGRDIVVDWEQPSKPEARQEQSKADTAQQTVTHAEENRGHVSAEEVQEQQPKAASIMPENQQGLRREKEESLERLLSPSNRLDSQMGSNASTASANDESSSQAPSLSDSPLSTRATLSPPSHSRVEGHATVTPGEVKAEDDEVAPQRTSSFPTSAPIDASPSPESESAEMEEAENNRARRARRKAEQDRASFKAKLLGWLGR